MLNRARVIETVVRAYIAVLFARQASLDEPVKNNLAVALREVEL